MKTLLVALLLFTTVRTQANGKKIVDEDYQAAKILTSHCAACHQAADHPGALFLNQARLSEKETLELITNLLEHSRMPPAHEEFKNTADGKTLLKWLKKKKKAATKEK